MATEQLAKVIALPVRGASATLGTWRRLIADDVDDWGRDHAFVRRTWSLAGLRWNVSVGGVTNLPRRGGGLIVVNARRLALAPVFTALAVGAAAGRPVRFIGRPDVAPLGPALQRLGGLLPSVDEVQGALRAGELVVLGAAHTTSNGQCGLIDHRFVGAALAVGAAVLPAASSSSPTSREARVEVGAAVARGRRRRGPLGELELADAVRSRIDELMLESGATLNGTPLDWFDWVGGVVGFGGGR
jgi:hypothetical protein